MIDDKRAVIHLAVEIVQGVVMTHIAGDAGALGHPIHPQCAHGAINMIAGNQGVNRRVKLDRRLLGSIKNRLHVDIVQNIVGDLAEDRPETADDARLSTMGNGVVAHDMTADALAIPSALQCALNGFDITAGGIGRGVVKLITIFAEGDPDAARMADNTVFNNPALTPMGTDQTNLLGCRRGPVGGSVTQVESAHGDEVDPGAARIKNRCSHVELNLQLVGIALRPMDPQACRGVADLGIPKSALQVGALACFAQFTASDINRCRVVGAAHIQKPVAANAFGERVFIGKNRIGNFRTPDMAILAGPGCGHQLGAAQFDDRALSGLVSDALRIRQTPARRIDPLAVDARKYPHGVSRMRLLGSSVDMPQRCVQRTIVAIISGNRDMDDAPRRRGLICLLHKRFQNKYKGIMS